MIKRSKIFTANILKIVLVLLAIIFSLLFYFKDDIKEHKVTKAKLEMFKRMMKTEPEQWPEEFNEVYDSMIAKKDTSVAK